VWTLAIGDYTPALYSKASTLNKETEGSLKMQSNHPWKYGVIQNNITIFTAIEISKPIYLFTCFNHAMPRAKANSYGMMAGRLQMVKE